jgi:Sigma-70, region 4
VAVWDLHQRVSQPGAAGERRYAALPAECGPPQPDFAVETAARLDEERLVHGVVAAVVVRLPRHEQDVFVLCAALDVSYEDAALALGIPIGPVRSRLSRARRHLQHQHRRAVGGGEDDRRHRPCAFPRLEGSDRRQEGAEGAPGRSLRARRQDSRTCRREPAPALGDRRSIKPEQVSDEGVPQLVDSGARSHNPEVAGSNPAPLLREARAPLAFPTSMSAYAATQRRPPGAK